MRIGIIGIGDICKKAYLPVLTARGDVELVLCTRNTKTIDDIKSRYRIKEAYTNIEDLIKSGIDAVMVHSSTESHFQICKMLLENNITVYVDKPIGYHYEEAKELYELSKKNNTKIMVGFNRRYVPKVRELKDLGNPDIIIMEKNRVDLPGVPRVFVFDDFIHVVDTIRFLIGEKHTDMSVKYKKDSRGLINVVLTLSNENTTAFAIMNRDNGVVEETIEYMASGKKAVVTSLVKTTKYENSKASIEEFGDWTPTLYKRGFEDIIEEFINFVKDKNYCSRYIEDALETHKICNDIVKIIENNK